MLFALVLGVYLLSPNVTNTDAYLAVPTAVSIVHSGDLDLDEFSSPIVRRHYGFIEVRGRHFDHFPWADALLFVPGVLVVDGLSRIGIGHSAAELVEDNMMGALQLATASLVTALAALVVAVVAYQRLKTQERTRRRAAFAVGAVFAFGTAAWSTASRALWQHGPSMLALGLALLFALRLERQGQDHPERRAWVPALALGAILATAYALRPTNAVAVVAFTALVALRHRDVLLWHLSGLTVVLGTFLAVNLASYGQVLPMYFGPGRISLHPAFLEAITANLVSPARGLLVFSPVVVLAAAGVVIGVKRRSVAPLDVVAAVCVAVHVGVVSAQNEGWWAGHAFGPRFLTDVLPFLAFLSLPAVQALLDSTRAGDRTPAFRSAAAAVALAIATSVIVNGQGALLKSSTCWNVEPQNIDHDPSRVWALRHPQVLAGFEAFATGSARSAVFGPCRGPTAAADLARG